MAWNFYSKVLINNVIFNFELVCIWQIDLTSTTLCYHKRLQTDYNKRALQCYVPQVCPRPTHFQYILKETQHRGFLRRNVTSNWKPIWIFSTEAGNVLQRNGYLHWTLNQTFVFTLTYTVNKSLCVYYDVDVSQVFEENNLFSFFDLVSDYTALKAGVSHPFFIFIFFFLSWQLFTSEADGFI